ncbi:MAG TPA: hypothetical protein VFU47_00215 [Armatimonadota bacterium]|nr:hypothetical protein [Armatimonadota bacterium]
MVTKLIVPITLALTVLAGAAAPALARDHRYDRTHRSARYYRTGRYYRDRNFSGDRQRVADRARRLYREGRLSRDHYERTLDKLNQRGGADWTNQVDNTLSKWSRSDRRR